MAGHEGSFDIEDRTFFYEVSSIEATNGTTYDGGDMDEHLHEADRIFYSAEADDGERYWRWIAGPFETWNDVEDAIADEADVYA